MRDAELFQQKLHTDTTSAANIQHVKPRDGTTELSEYVAFVEALNESASAVAYQQPLGQVQLDPSAFCKKKQWTNGVIVLSRSTRSPAS